MTQSHNSRKGFTLIELLLVVLISAFLSAIVITYSSVGRNEITLSVQSTALAQTLARARALALATYRDSAAPSACGYGVAFNAAADTYSVVVYEKPAGATSCPDATTVEASGIVASNIVQYTPSTWGIALQNGVKFAPPHPGSTTLTLAVFYPPEPAALLSESSCLPGDPSCTYAFISSPGTIGLATIDGAANAAITVGTTGQISW